LTLSSILRISRNFSESTNSDSEFINSCTFSRLKYQLNFSIQIYQRKRILDEQKARELQKQKEQEEEDKLEQEIAKIESRISSYIDLDEISENPKGALNHSLKMAKSKTLGP
jgi:hypothetical protein